LNCSVGDFLNEFKGSLFAFGSRILTSPKPIANVIVQRSAIDFLPNLVVSHSPSLVLAPFYSPFFSIALPPHNLAMEYG